MTDTKSVDVIIIGSGQGGVPLATHFAQQGQSVALFERGALGGSCVNYGCTPSKAFLASAHLAAQTKRGEALGVQLEATVDFPAVMKRVRKLIDSFNDGVQEGLEAAGVNVIKAEATFVDKRTVSGGDHCFEASNIVINTGRSPRIPDVAGLEDTPYLTYENFWQLDELPPTTLVLGGGYVGLELGQGLARLGSQVHIIERSDQILSKEDRDVSAVLQQGLEADDIQIHASQEAKSVSYDNDQFNLELANGKTLTGDMLLVATGRVPNTDALNLSASNIQVDDKKFIQVNEQFQTECDGIFAIGDVINQPAFTHISWEDHRRLIQILNGEARQQGDRVLGYAVFTEPQVGRAGLSVSQANAQGIKVRAAKMPLSNVARATEAGYNHGFYQMVVDAETDKILGATLIGPDAAELIHIFIAHMAAGSTWQRLEQSVHIHPAFAEALPGLARKFQD